jgi:hypothetical protein
MSDRPLEQLLAAGGPAFLDALDGEADPARLKRLARCWAGDTRPEARRLLLDYLGDLLNPLHEPLVFRLFECAGKAGDDEVLAAFLVLADRSLRPDVRRDGALILRPTGYRNGQALGDVWLMEAGKSMRVVRLSPEQQKEHAQHRLFGVEARLRLRRRVWHYFQRLGREQPQRYVAAVTRALLRYTADDTPNPAALLDNWCLCHVLYHESNTIRATRHGASWHGRLAHLPFDAQPAPAYEALWSDAPRMLLHLMGRAPCALVRAWASDMLRRQSTEDLAQIPAAELFEFLPGAAPTYLVRAILATRGLDDVPADHWVDWILAQGNADPNIVAVFQVLPPERLSVEQAIRLATSASPVAPIGFTRYLSYHLDRGALSVPQLLSLLDARHDGAQLALAVRVTRELKQTGPYERRWALAFFESASRNVRETGWLWFGEDTRLSEDVELWRCLIASRHAEVRERLLAWLLEWQTGRPMALRDSLPLDDEAVLVLWARLLLTLYGPWRRSLHRLAWQLVARLEWRSADHVHLLPMLAELLRQSSGPAWRTTLAGVVRLVEEHPAWQPLVAAAMPELNLSPE